jgi:uroporphyrinogen decarboxylase
MTTTFSPDYTRIVSAAQNKKTKGVPLYEHDINRTVIGAILQKDLHAMYESRDPKTLDKLFKTIAGFHIEYGYDTYSFEGCFTELIQNGKGLTGQAGSIINNREEFEAYPWESLTEKYFQKFGIYFAAIRNTLPEGMKIVGGVGNGIFETIQDFVPFTDLAYLEVDDPDLFFDIWKKVGDVLNNTWKRFLDEYSNILAVGRFGDDLGFKSAPLLNPQIIIKHILPQYKIIVSEVKSRNIPFLLHTCGHIFSVMDEIIEVTGIDAKHSNEDSIAPFSRWVEDYGQRIGNFGGLDMDVICRSTEDVLRKYIRKNIEPLMDSRGIAIGSGNQIADYVPPENFQIMVDEVRGIRGF